MEPHLVAAGPGWALALEQSGLGAAMRGSVWLYPAVETLHILGFALLVGSIASFDLRAARAPTVDAVGALAAGLLPFSRAGFALAAPMGLLLFVTEATAYVANPVFLAKMALLALALVNIAWFHARLTRARDGRGAVGALRASALLSVASWAAVLIAGRMIAYV